MRFPTGLRAISLATVVALVGITAWSAPAAASDPAPSPAPTESPQPSDSPSPEPTPAPDPTPEPAATPVPDPSPTPSPTDAAPTAAPESPAPDPTASPDPSATATSPDPSPLPDPTPAPSATTSPAPAATTTTAQASVRARIVRIALNQRGDRYRRGATGPSAFDCSGLVRYAYRKAGVSRYLGGGHSARAMLLWGRRHGLTSRHHPRIGDIVIYGNGSHAAIYIGRGRVISALNPRQGIRITALHALRAPFTTFIHTRLP